MVTSDKDVVRIPPGTYTPEQLRELNPDGKTVVFGDGFFYIEDGRARTEFVDCVFINEFPHRIRPTKIIFPDRHHKKPKAKQPFWSRHWKKS